MKLKEFKKFLEQFPDDATVEVIVNERGRNWEGDYAYVRDFIGDEFGDYDYTEYKNERTLCLGTQDGDLNYLQKVIDKLNPPK